MAFSFSPLLNGERAVVALFIAAVLSSLPTSLFSHGISLSLLSLSALFVEIRADSLLSLPQFKTRQGVSSGIVLGAVTLPAVMLSKLIQLSRAYSSSEIELHELNYLAMQYWAALSASFSVLIFLCSTMDNTHSSKRKTWPAKFSLVSGVTCAALFFFSNAGSDVALKLPWVLLHGFAAVKLVQHLLHTFPSCTSIGEALLMTAGLVLYFADMLACTVAKLYENLKSSELVSSQYRINTSEIGIIIQGLLFGLLLFPSFFKFVLWVSDCLLGIRKSTARAYTERGRSCIFFASLAFVMIVAVPLWMQFVQSFHVHPFLWVLTFVFSEPVKRLSFCFYWVCLINVFILWVYNISKSSKLERILLRKYYHLMAVLMFLPAGIWEPEFLGLAFGAALVVFLATEIIRVWRIWPLGQPIHQFMNAFTDHRDSDLLIISHFSLLLGCALPMWMSSGYNDRPLAPFAGILSLGIGDTMASVVGHKYGVLRWSKTGKKTIEGTAAGITGVLAASLILLTSIGYIFTQHWVSIIVAVIVSGLLEAYTAQLDNAFIPLVFYSLLCL